jgi:Ca-activated chloride channel family protein
VLRPPIRPTSGVRGRPGRTETSRPASPENPREALRFIGLARRRRDRAARGDGARVRDPRLEGVARTIVIPTAIEAEKDVFDYVRDHLTWAASLFGIGSSVNRYLLEGLARPARSSPSRSEEAEAAVTAFREYISRPS